MQRLCIFVIAVMLFELAPLAHGEQLRIVDNLPGFFEDISSSTPLVLGDDDEVGVGTTLGNFVFPSGTVVVANNGGVAFRNPPSADLAPVNQPIPSAAAFGGGQALLVYWDDFDDKDGDVFLSQKTDDLIIQWNNRLLLGGASPGTATVQLKVHGNIGPSGIVAQLIFGDVQQPGVDGGAGATIGYQDGGAGFRDFQWSFNTAGAVANGTVLSLVLFNEPVPATSAWTLVIMLIGLLVAGTVIVHRRTRAAQRA